MSEQFLFMVHEIAVRYHRPAMLNELLCVTAAPPRTRKMKPTPPAVNQ